MRRRSNGHDRRVAPFGRRHIAIVSAIAIGLTAATVGGAAHAATPQEELAAKAAQAKKLDEQIQGFNSQADVLDEQLLQAQDDITKAKTKIASAERQISLDEGTAKDLRKRLSGRAAKLYMGAGNSDPFSIDATDVRELGTRAKYGSAAAQQESQLIDDLKLAESNLAVQQRDLKKQQTAAEMRQRDAEKAKKGLDKNTADVTRLRDSIKGDMATLLAKVQAQREAEQAARVQAQLVARHQLTNDGGGGGGGGGGSNDGGTGTAPNNPPPASGGAAAAIAFAQQQIGKWYQYAGAGPDVWDCSGLTMVAWAHGGVAMDHGSQSQYDSFPHVPISQLQPGDLVFFGDSGPTNHHVGLYVGGGTMIEAPHTGAQVRYASIYRPDLVPLGSRP